MRRFDFAWIAGVILGILMMTTSAGQAAVSAGYQHQHTKVVWEPCSLSAVHHLSAHIDGILGLGFLRVARTISNEEKDQSRG